LNHRKKIKADSGRLILRKLTTNLHGAFNGAIDFSGIYSIVGAVIPWQHAQEAACSSAICVNMTRS